MPGRYNDRRNNYDYRRRDRRYGNYGYNRPQPQPRPAPFLGFFGS
ncbi:hypothetical protein [Gordonia asplenii]|nr:hypothetical protein [Gordonia asplenii]